MVLDWTKGKLKSARNAIGNFDGGCWTIRGESADVHQHCVYRCLWSSIDDSWTLQNLAIGSKVVMLCCNGFEMLLHFLLLVFPLNHLKLWLFKSVVLCFGLVLQSTVFRTPCRGLLVASTRGGCCACVLANRNLPGQIHVLSISIINLKHNSISEVQVDLTVACKIK